MNKALLVTRPAYDNLTNYLFYWSEFVIKKAVEKNFRVLDLKKKRANKKDLESYIKKHNPILVFLNGHGSETKIAGYDDEILIEADSNEIFLSGRVIYARTCDAAKELGHRCIKKGTIAFIGYEREFSLVYFASRITHPLHDEIARLFLEPSNLVPISLLKGNTAYNSYKRSQGAMYRNFLFMISTKASQDQRDAAPYLWSNKKYQKLLGDPGAKL